MEIREITVVYNKPKIKKLVKIDSSQLAYNLLLDSWNKTLLEYQEEFKAILLDRGNHVLGIFNQSKGGITSTIVDQRITFAVALKSKATGIILAHNHPSGTLVPSEQDKALTKRFVKAGKILDIEILDHIILTSQGYVSFADKGLLV